MAEQKITLPMLELDLQKVTTFVSRPFRLTQGDKGYIQPFHLSMGFVPYSATADTLCFAGTKPDGQVIEVEAEPSRFSKDGDTWFFSLPDEVAQAIGTFEAYFYVKKGNSIVASTTKFAYEVSAKFGDDEASNSYVSTFEALRDKFNQIIESSRTELNNWTSLNNQAKADLDKLLKDLKTQTDNWLSAKSSEIQGIITNYNSKYNELVGKWNNQITTQQSDYTAQKAKIDSEYKQQLENLKAQLNSEWQTQKQAQQASFDSFKADLTNRISQAKTDIDNIQAKIPELQSKLDAINGKVRDVDFNGFVKSVQGVNPDSNGNVDLTNKFADKIIQNVVNLNNPMFHSTQSVDDFAAMGSPNKTQTLTTYRSDFNANDDGKPGLANYSQGLIFGAWTERGVLSISNKEHKARIAGGTYHEESNGFPVWSEDIAWKSDFANYYSKSEIDSMFKSIVLNIVDFGAKAEDSNFDNAPAFNRAIQSLPSTGGIIYIPNGNFFLKSTVTIDRSYVHIMGLNHGLRSGIDPSDGTTQTGGGGAKVTVQNSISAFKIQNTHNDKRLSGITFSGFDLKGDTNSGVGIDGVSNTDRVVIDNMTINNIGIGVKLIGADAPRITNSWIAETKSSIQLTGASQQVEIKNNSLGAQPQGVTILLENADRYNITGNNIYPDGSSAIRLLNPVHGAIVGNTISAFYTGIIEMLPNGRTYGNSNVISGNVIAIETWKNNPIGRDNKWGIIHIEGYNNLIAGNNILSNGSPQNTTGVLIMKGDSNKIASNIINIPNTDSNVVCNGEANNNSVIFSTKGNSFQNGFNSSNINVDVDSYTALQNRCEALETNLTILQSKINNLLTLVAVSGDTVSIQGNLEIHGGQIRNYWGGTDQYVAYTPSGVRRGHFGVYDDGSFHANG